MEPRGKKVVPAVSIIIPVYNEQGGLAGTLTRVRQMQPEAEIIVVNDGSGDDSAEISRQAGVRVLSHPYNMGNGAAIKTGARAARGEILVFMDADGQHDPEDIERLVAPLSSGYEMSVGARSASSQASLARRFANGFYNQLASWMTGYRIEDLTSGFRAARARHFRKFLYLLPNGFSYPTTSTMAFFRSGFPVAYVPIKVKPRIAHSKSNIRWLKDGVRFFVIILKIGALFSPMRLFLPISGLLFLIGLSYYSYTYFNYRQFTNMSALLLLASLSTFLIGILSEQVSSLHYRNVEEDQRRTVRGREEQRED